MEKKRLCCDIDADVYWLLKQYCLLNDIKFGGLINVLLNYAVIKLLKLEEM